MGLLLLSPSVILLCNAEAGTTQMAAGCLMKLSQQAQLEKFTLM